jgi:hypothetical protein
VGKGEIAVERRSRGPTSDSRARRRICDAEYFCDTNLACRRGRSCPNRVKGGCGRQADGTAGLTPAPEIPGASRHLRFVPETEVTAVGVQAQLLAFMLRNTLKISECRLDTVT